MSAGSADEADARQHERGAARARASVRTPKKLAFVGT